MVEELARRLATAAEKLKAKIPVGLVQITYIPGLGPKRVRLLHTEIGVTSGVGCAAVGAAASPNELVGVVAAGSLEQPSVSSEPTTQRTRRPLKDKCDIARGSFSVAS